MEEPYEHLKCVLALLAKHQLYANKRKCQLRQTEIEYLGHIISKKGVAADQTKIKEMCVGLTPKILDLHGFLSLS